MKLKNLLGLAMLGSHRVTSDHSITLEHNRLLVGGRAVTDVNSKPETFGGHRPGEMEMMYVNTSRGASMVALDMVKPARIYNLEKDVDRLMRDLQRLARARV
jgi:hypothetical protein